MKIVKGLGRERSKIKSSSTIFQISSYVVEKRDVLKDEWTVVASSGEMIH